MPEHLTPLGPWLEARLPTADAVELRDMRKPSSGFSADTVMVDVAVTRAGIPNDERVRAAHREPGAADLPGAGAGLGGGDRAAVPDHGHARPPPGVPVAPMIGYEPDPRGAGHAVLRDGLRRRPGAGGEPAVHDQAGFFLDVAPRRTHADDRARAGDAWRASTRSTGAPPGSTGWCRRATTPGLDAQVALWERVLPGRAARPGAPARSTRAFAWLHAERPRMQPGRALLGRPAPGQHHLARRGAGVRHRLRGGVDRAAGARPRLVADVRPHHARGRRARRVPTATRRASEQLAHVRGGVGTRRCPTSGGSRSARRRATAPSSCGS